MGLDKPEEKVIRRKFEETFDKLKEEYKNNVKTEKIIIGTTKQRLAKEFALGFIKKSQQLTPIQLFKLITSSLLLLTSCAPKRSQKIHILGEGRHDLFYML